MSVYFCDVILLFDLHHHRDRPLTLNRVFGFLAGAVFAGASVYYYILGDYRVANEMLSDDISVCTPGTLHLVSVV